MKAFQYLQYAMFAAQTVSTFLVPLALVYIIRAAKAIVNAAKGDA